MGLYMTYRRHQCVFKRPTEDPNVFIYDLLKTPIDLYLTNQTPPMVAVFPPGGGFFCLVVVFPPGGGFFCLVGVFPPGGGFSVW